jgi:hypothetical protein
MAMAWISREIQNTIARLDIANEILEGVNTKQEAKTSNLTERIKTKVHSVILK